MHIFEREIKPELYELAKSYPVVTITGPRQSGKTTLTKTAFPQLPYANLEELDIRSIALEDPREFLGRYPLGVILDEIQHAPELLSYIQVIVDEQDKMGQFILTGSQQLSVHQGVTQSLAGRVGLLELLPLTISEVQQIFTDLTTDQNLLRGFYPRVHKRELNPTKEYANYIRTYVERDVRSMINIKDLDAFQRFLKLCAARIGHVLNISSLANDVGVSQTTIANWLSILEASYIIVRLQPYFENFGKRIIKSPKLYFYDVGLAVYLLGMINEEQVNLDRLRGELFENMVVVELIKKQRNVGREPNLYYYRDSNQNEVDVIYQSGRTLIPIEIKSAQTYRSNMTTSLEKFRELSGDRCGEGYLVYAGDQEQKIKKNHLTNYKNLSDIFK